MEQREDARRAVAQLLAADARDVSLVESTTQGLAAVLGAMPWRPGDNAVLGDREFPGAATILRTVAHRCGIEVRAVPGDVTVESVLGMVDARTRAVVVSAVAEVTGRRLDVPTVAAGLGQAGPTGHGAALVVDGAQEAGVIAVDLPGSGAAAYACGGHKWLRSPFGTGFLWTAPWLRESLRPTRGYLALDTPSVGWPEYLANPDRDALDPLPLRGDGAALEIGGTPAWCGAVALAHAADRAVLAGPARTEATALRLAAALREGLRELGLHAGLADPVGGSGIVTVAPPGGVRTAPAVAAALEARGVLVSARAARGVGGLRFSVHGHDRDEDVAAALSGLDNVLRRGRH